MKRIYLGLALLVSFVVGLSGCGKKEPVAPPDFGSLEETTAEETSAYGFETGIKGENGETREYNSDTDEFQVSQNIDMDDANKTTEELQVEYAEEKEQEYTYIGLDNNEHNMQEEYGVKGILNYVKVRGGTEEIREYYTPDELKKELTNMYMFATKEEINNTVDIIFNGTDEDRQRLDEDSEHIGDNWVYTEDGWVDLSNQGNVLNSNIAPLDENFSGSYEPVDIDSVEFIGY